MKKLLSLISVLLLLVILVLGSGAYNMAATEKHWSITEKIIEWARENSIEVRARDLTVPPLDGTELLAKGAEHYNAMCTTCHLAPGLKPTELSTGLYPQAPVFHQREPITDQIDKLDHAKEYFWVIKNGLKMTAMPAWGLSHDDDTIWAMTAFVLKLHGMATEQYKDLVESAKHSSHDHTHDHP